ncbi:GSCOCG00012088001-RA-CDS, partial [Cotesia congregata]
IQIHPGSLEHKSAAIACRRFYGTHSFDAIAEQLSDIHSSFRLTAQSIRATVTDNGSNFVKDFKEFGIEATYETDFDAVDENVEISDEFATKCEDKLPRHFRCASHSLNLVATTDCLKAINNSKTLKKKYFNVIGKCSSLWKSLRSPKTSESLKSYLGVSLKRPVVTRWNSTYDYFKFLAEYVRCSKPLACAIDRLQGDKCYYGVLLPTLVSVKYEMQKLINDTTMRSMNSTSENFLQRFLNFNQTGFALLEKFPSIRKVFLKFNTPLPSSAPAERLFSHVTMMNLPRYNRLTDEYFEQ